MFQCLVISLWCIFRECRKNKRNIEDEGTEMFPKIKRHRAVVVHLLGGRERGFFK